MQVCGLNTPGQIHLCSNCICRDLTLTSSVMNPICACRTNGHICSYFHFLVHERSQNNVVIKCHKPKRVLMAIKPFHCLNSLWMQQYISLLWMFWFLSCSDLHSTCVDVVWSTCISFLIPPRLLSLGMGYMLARPKKCQNVSIDIEETMIKMYSRDDKAWFIIFLILCMYFTSQDHDGGDLLVFLSEAWIRIDVYEISIMLTYLTPTSFIVHLYFLLKCIYVFTVLLCVALQAFSWDRTSLDACFWKKKNTWAETIENILPLIFTQFTCGKSTT